MSETNIPVSSGSGNNVDVFSLTNTNLRQSVVVGDSSIAGNVAPVQATDPSSNAFGVVVRDVNSSAIVAKLNSVVVSSITGSIGVYFDRGNPTVTANVGTGSMAVYFDRGNPTVTIDPSKTAAVYLSQTAGTLVVKIDPAGAAFVNAGHTASIFTVSGSTSGISASGVMLVSPSANYSFKIFAFQLTTTAQSQVMVRFTNGAGTSPTEYWRYGLQAPSQGIAGANLAVTPPGFIFATGTSTTLALLLDTSSLIHYSVSYIKESA